MKPAEPAATEAAHPPVRYRDARHDSPPWRPVPAAGPGQVWQPPADGWHPGRNRAARVAAGLGSLAVLAALVTGLPAALYLLAGSPLPHQLPTWHQLLIAAGRPDDGTLFLTAVRSVTWLAWGIFTLTVLGETSARIRRRPAPWLHAMGPARTFAAALVGTMILGLLPARHTPSPRSPGTPVTAGYVTTASPPPPGTGPGIRDAGQRAAPPPQACPAPDPQRHPPGPPTRQRIYRVRTGDNLWDIAARYLGNTGKWRTIFDLNRGRPQPGGLRLTDPGHIDPGWTLLLPPRHVRRTTCSAPRHHPGESQPGRRPSPDLGHRPGSRRQLPGPPGITLPGGGLVPLALAAAVSGAAVLASIQRRRAYKPAPQAPSRLRPSEPPEQPVITRLRRAASKPAPAPAPPLSAPARVPARQVALGIRDGHEITADISALQGLGLTGPGALPAARALLASLAGQALQSTHAQRQDVIVPAGDIAVLLPGWNHSQHQGRIPGLTLTPTLDAALDHAESPQLQRARTAGTSRTGRDPGTPKVPAPVVLIASTRRPAVRRLHALTESGQAPGLAVITIGAWPGGTTCHVNTAGIASCPGTDLDGARLYSLSDADATAIIATLQAAHAGTSARTAPATRQPARRDASENPAPTRHDTPPRTATAFHVPPASPRQGTPPATGRQPAAAGGAPHDQPRPSPAGSQRQQVPGRPAPAGTGPQLTGRRIVHVEVLGPLRITAAGHEVSGGLRKARELLAYLAIHPAGITADAISEALWPDSPASHGISQRNLALRKLRQLLRTATGLTEPMFITLAAGRYRLDPAHISTDIAAFESALEQARNTPGDTASLTGWQQAAALYRGPLADGAGYDWAEPYAETARRRALDAWTRIAELLEPDSADQAMAALETALTHDPYNEDLYQRIMRMQIARGQPDAARRTLSLLSTRLAELGLTPAAQTRQLLDTPRTT